MKDIFAKMLQGWTYLKMKWIGLWIYWKQRYNLWASHRLTQHKRFVPYGTHPNFCFAKTSFMLETLAETGTLTGEI